jgi:uncharacterized membrane protein
MTAATVLSIAYAVNESGQSAASAFRWAAAIINSLGLVSTIVFNVPINLATGRWNAEHLPENWKQVRNRWEFFQALRSYLFLIGFILVSVAISY